MRAGAADPRRLELLDLIVFFTAGEDKEAVAKPAPRLDRLGGRGTIHGEIQDGFVRAEVVGWEDLVDAGGYAPARDRGRCAPRAATTSSPTAM